MPPQLFGLITGTNLAHLNTDLQNASEVPDQATEIDPVGGGEIKDGLLAIEGKIHTDQLHGQVDFLDAVAAQGKSLLGPLTHSLGLLEIG